MNEWLPTPEELSAPLHRASVRKGVQLEALSCPPPSAAGREGGPGSPVFLEPRMCNALKPMWRYQ